MAIDRTILRVASRHKPYAQLGNAMLRDKRLSFEARGVLAFILTYPSNWQFGLAWLCRDQDIGRDRARRIIREHVTAGYCQRGEPGTLTARSAPTNTSSPMSPNASRRHHSLKRRPWQP
jgi:hypothetical protein